MIHNRHDHRVEDFIASLQRQSLLPYEVIIADTSDDDDLQALSLDLCTEARVTHVKAKSSRLDKARAYNIALQLVDSAYTLFTDIDLIFHPDFIARVSHHLQEPNTFVQAVTAYLPQDACGDTFDDLLAIALREGGEVSHRLSPGACQASTTAWFRSVGGYDERFRYLGGVDDDMMVRAKRANLDIIWIDDIMTLHQWHEPSPWKGVDTDLFDAESPIVANKEKG
jgi:glycosyltransferase involved in cell wall biosynthesis